MKRQRALICVDVQNDFLPGGALGVPDGHRVIPVLIEKMEDVDVIILSADWHPADHMSFSDNPTFEDGSWPPHCVANTHGSVFDQQLLNAALDSGKPVIIVYKGTNLTYEAYSAFEGSVTKVYNDPEADIYLHHKDLLAALLHFQVNTIFVGGLALDYCVAWTASDASADEFYVEVLLSATRPVNYVTGALAVAKLVDLGVAVSG